MDTQTETSAQPPASTKTPLMDVVERPHVAFDLGSSLLQGAFATDTISENKSTHTTRYDPVAQLMDSDDSDDASNSVQRGGPTKVRSDSDAEDIPHMSFAAMAENDSSRLGAESKVLDIKPQKKRKPLKAARFKLDKGVKRDSVVGRMAAAHRARGINSDTSDDSDREADNSDIKQRVATKKVNHRNALDTDSDTDSGRSDSEPGAKQAELGDGGSDDSGLKTEGFDGKDKVAKSSSADSSSKNKGRAASKAAMAKIHQESERLVRETAINIDPEEFTQRLTLDDFLHRFDTRSRIPPAKKLRKAFVVPPVQTKGTFTFAMGDGSSELVVVEDDSLMPQSHASAGVLKLIHQSQHAKPLVRENALDAILSHGSQPLHVSETRATGLQRTGGPLALRDLNSALLDVMYKKDVESRLAAAEKKAKRQRDKEEKLERRTQSQQGPTKVEDDYEEAQMGSDDDVNESEAEEPGDGAISRGKRHTAGVYDDFAGKELVTKSASSSPSDVYDTANCHTDTKMPPTTTAAAIVAPVSKNKFVSMFRMPVREVAISPEKMAAKASQRDGSPEFATPSQQDSAIPISQDLPDLFSSQIGTLNTQDSLLMTPDMETQRNQQSLLADEYSDELQLLPATQQQSQVQMQPDQIMSTRPTQLTNPTQPLDTDNVAGQTQQTQLTISTVATADASTSSTAILPTMVRRALDANSSEHDDDGIQDEPASDAELPQPAPLELDENQAEPESPARLRKQGRLLRRKGGGLEGSAAAVREKPKRLKRSEFVEAEAEEGESSDSEGESKTVKHRKFNWGNDTTELAADSEDEEDLDMDTDEEEAALLADPMIDNDVEEDDSGDEAIRDLHRQRNFDEDEKDIQNLFRDVTTGRLRNRNARDKAGLGFADEEDYNDRQTRAERMEERLRMRRKLLAREIHDSNLAEIARDPETAAFAQAALMRAPTADGRADSTDAEDAALSDGAFELEEEVDEHSIATTVQRHLARQRMRIDSDVESDTEDSRRAADRSNINVSWRAAGRVASGRGDSQSSIFEESMADDDLGSDVFSTVEIEKLIVRRRTMLSTDTNQGAASKQGAAWRPLPLQQSLLKRAGVSMAAANAKRFNSGSQ
ncbi:hypothetical protein H4R24_003517 [Coemansia sp. RSA 988]|nr:hypothetical protein H4R24_003517 [Coemansia sp. RSA 988]